MKTALFVLLLLVLAAAWWRRRSATGDRRPGSSGSPWRCVSVSVGLNACRPAQRLGDRRFLPREAPALPLPGCDERRCACRYVHHADRRTDERRDPFSRLGMLAPEDVQDRRRGRERRRAAY